MVRLATSSHRVSSDTRGVFPLALQVLKRSPRHAEASQALQTGRSCRDAGTIISDNIPQSHPVALCRLSEPAASCDLLHGENKALLRKRVAAVGFLAKMYSNLPAPTDRPLLAFMPYIYIYLSLSLSLSISLPLSP